MAKRYGVPYGMSKNRIAKRLIDFLPPADTFVDLFAGGCAVAHAALESRKYNHVIINDINPLPTQLFVDAVAGKYRDERRVIDRETFHRLKDSDPYVKYCWSFGTKGTTYLWGKKIEPVKLAACRMILCDGEEQKESAKEFQALTKNGFDGDLLDWILEAEKWEERLARYTKYIKKVDNFGEEVRVQALERLNELQSLPRFNSIMRYALDYRAVPIPRDSVVYCDIPYEGTECTQEICSNFNYSEFFEWAKNCQNVFVSSFNLPEHIFESVRGWNRHQTMSGDDRKTKVLEKIFVPCVA